jgi:hypothetical protein
MVTPGDQPEGMALIRASLVGSAVFVVAAALAVAIDGPPRSVFVALSLVMFALGSLAYLLGYAQAVARSRDVEIGMAGFVVLAGVAPPQVRRLLLGSTAVEVVAALTAAAVRPFTSLAFGILAPVFGLGLQSLWSARHGRFPQQVAAVRRPGNRP